MRYFETKFLDEADEFIAKLDLKTIKKMLYNIDLAEQTNDPRLFKKLQGDIWEFRTMATKKIKIQTLTDMKDKYIGKIGSNERDRYEHELRMDVLGKMIKAARQERNLTQEQLGKLVGVQKAQISKLESSTNSATIATILKVFKALKAEIHFNVKLEDHFVELT